VLGIRDVSAVRNQCILPDRKNALNILESGEAPKARYNQSTNRAPRQVTLPKLSAARTMPLSYFIARTDVPTIFGSVVCVVGVAMAVAGWKDGWTGCIGSMFGKRADGIVDMFVCPFADPLLAAASAFS
jgi:hypothetical protein